jgi:hypothetical protein
MLDDKTTMLVKQSSGNVFADVALRILSANVT